MTQDELIIDFSSTIYPHANQRWLKMHLAEKMDCIGQYPPLYPDEVEALIAKQLGISEESVLVTNGCTEAIYLMARLYRGRTSIIPLPTYQAYADACRMYRHTISFEKTDDLSSLPENRIYWICNPNNPTGNVLMKGFMDYIVRRSKNYIYIIDQSCEYYTREGMLMPRELCDLPNVILLHSMSKQYCIPGLRIGYITAHPSIITQLREMRTPWAVNSMAIEAAKFLLEQGTSGVPNLDAYLSEAERLHSELEKIGGIKMLETKTNFMLGQLDNVTTAELKQHLLEHHNILIHDCSRYEGLNNYSFRVTARTPKDDDQLITAIRLYMEDI